MLLKVGVAHAAALLAVTALGASAQAQTFSPESTAVSGVAGAGTDSDPTLNYGDAVWTCDTATMEGVSGTDSDRIQDVEFDFQEPCNISGILDVTVDCGAAEDPSTVDLIAQDATNNTATVDLNDDLRCVFTIEGACNLIIEGPQTTQGNNLTLNTTTDEVTANVDMHMTNDGSELCGPPSGTAGLDAVYEVTPPNLDIVP